MTMQDILDDARRDLAPGPPSTFGESARSAFRLSMETQNAGNSFLSLRKDYETYLDEFQSITGERPSNPLDASPGAFGAFRRAGATGRAQYRAAANAFSAVRNIEENNGNAHLGRTISQIRLGVLGLAMEGLGTARHAGAELGPSFEARVLAAEGRVHLMQGRIAAAAAKATASVAADARCSEGHLLLADIASQRNQNSLPELRLAIQGNIRQPEAMARVYLAEQEADDACTNARGYQ